MPVLGADERTHRLRDDQLAAVLLDHALREPPIRRLDRVAFLARQLLVAHRGLEELGRLVVQQERLRSRRAELAVEVEYLEVSEDARSRYSPPFSSSKRCSISGS